MQLYLAGHLGWYDKQRRRTIEVCLAQPTLLTGVLASLNVPLTEIAIGVVNGEAIFSLDNVTVTSTDKVDLYPPVDGG